MNEKFFDLKKEKQDRMINAGLKVFALNGYHHASTDEIVKEARISKGLLFHYFGSKSGYYAFLYDYISRYVILELSSEIRDPSVDYFELQEEILGVESGLMEQYPFLFLFLESVRLEDDGEGLSALEESPRDVLSCYGDMIASSQTDAYVRIGDFGKLTEMLRFLRIQVMRELLSDPTEETGGYLPKMKGFLDLLKHLSSAL